MIVPGEGPCPCDWMFLGQNPGYEELMEGHPFVGKAGKDLWQGMKRFAGFTRSDLYVTNAVKIGTPKNRLPNNKERAAALPELLEEIERVNPKVIITAGSFATKVIMGNVNISTVHGIPHEVELLGVKRICLPMYHPAAGLHNKGTLAAIAFDLERIGACRRHEIPTWALTPLRAEVWGQELSIGPLPARSWVAVDTEGWPDKPICLNYSPNGHDAFVIAASDTTKLKHLKKWLNNKTIVMHNGLHDLPVLAAMGIEIKEFHDTQVLAYHDIMRTGSGVLEAEAQNLGTLAYRELSLVLSELSDLAGVSFSDQEIPLTEEVVQYAGMDAIATWRLFQVYRQRGLLDYQPYQIDMGQVHLVRAMIDCGVPFDVDATTDYLITVRDRKASVTEELQLKAMKQGLRDFNPGSHPQVRKLLVEKQGLRIYKRTKGGLASTGAKAIADHKSNPFVGMIQKYRELDKLEGTYLTPLLQELVQ